MQEFKSHFSRYVDEAQLGNLIERTLHCEVATIKLPGKMCL
jgi:hypothetical protein